MPLLMDVFKYYISYQFRSKFEKLNTYSFAYIFFMDIGIALYHPFTEFMVKQTPRHTYFLYRPNLESRHEGTYSYS